MANNTNGNPWILDTVGLIADHPVSVRKIIMIPNAESDAATIYCYNNGSPLATMGAKTTTVSSGVLTSTGNFEATEVAAYGVIEILATSKTSAGAASENIRLKRMVASRDSDNQITTAPTDLTDEASGVYSWKTYSPIEQIYMKASSGGGTDTELASEVFEATETGGHRMPNFILGALTASAKLYVYI